MERCPFSGAGQKTQALLACPGYEADAVEVAVTAHGRQDRLEVSCRHLEAVTDRWGFMPGCARPGGLPVSREQAAAIIERTRPRQAARRSAAGLR